MITHILGQAGAHSETRSEWELAGRNRTADSERLSDSLLVGSALVAVTHIVSVQD